MTLYFIVPESFAIAHIGASSSIAPDTFNARKLTDGTWACSINTIVSFPEFFEHQNFLVRSVAQEEFEQDTTNPEL